MTLSHISATSVSLSWSQPEFSLPVFEYTVSLTRVTGSGQTLCPLVQDDRQEVITTENSTSFTDLEEFSTYRATVTAVFDAFNSTAFSSIYEDFATLSAGMINS